MKPDVPYIEAKFQEFNSLMFDNALPPVPVALSKASSYVGLCTFKTRRHLFGKVEHYDFRLRFSTRLDLPEAEVEDTIIHEMIHYYIRLNRIKDTSAHGKVFRQMMNELNSRFGRHITISHRTTKEQREAVWGSLVRLLKTGGDNVMQETRKALLTKLEAFMASLERDKKQENLDA